MLSPSSMLTSWMLTVDWISAVVIVNSGSPDSSDAMLSAFGSSVSPAVDTWCRMDGRLLDRIDGAETVVGLTVGDRMLVGSGVVGDSGWEVSPPWKPGT